MEEYCSLLDGFVLCVWEERIFQSHYVNASGDLKGVTTPTYIHTYV